MTLIFATCHSQPLIAPDDAPLAAALAARGVTVTPIPWTEIDPYAVLDAPPIVLRSTWDYHRVPTMFLSWLRALEDSGRIVSNGAATALGNVDKIYLRELGEQGIAIPKTRWLDRIDNAAIDRVLAEEGWDRAVLKPRIAATAYGTFLVARGAQLSDENLAPARSCGALVQAFVPEIETSGEISLVYIDGAFSHSVSKHAKHGDYRVQQDFGGTVKQFTPSPELLCFGGDVMTQATEGTLYARVDIVDTMDGPLLMELELIEPELYFTIVPAAADTLAAAIVRRLT